MEGIEVFAIYDVESDNPDFVRFKEKYKERFTTIPDVIVLLTYETTGIALQGLKEKSRKVSVKDAVIQKGHYEGLQWDLDIDQFGDSFIEPRWFVISGGRYVSVQ